MPGSANTARAGGRDPEPQRFAGPLGDLVEDLLNAQLLERAGHEIELTHRHAAAQDDDVVRVEMKLEPLAQLLAVVPDVIVRDPLEAVPAQGARHRVHVRAPDLDAAGSARPARSARYRSRSRRPSAGC